ncbi:prolipoprotein diacylglyceryl transferase family protein, partial [Gemmatimonadota bacterium]
MYPNLFRLPEWFPLIGGEYVTSFGMMMFFAFLTAGLAHRAEMKRQGFDPDISWDVVFGAVVGGILGAKLYYILLNYPRLLEDPAGLIFARGG